MINVNFTFTPLREVWLGNCYPEQFYNHLPNEIADPFRKITEWTQNDLFALQTWLQEKGIVVRRPVFESVDQYLDSNDRLVKPPVTPRDDFLVLEKKLHVIHQSVCKHNAWQHWLDLYQKQESTVIYHSNDAMIGGIANIVDGKYINPNNHDSDNMTAINPPSIVKVGQDIYIDTESHNTFPGQWQQVCEWMVEASKDYRVNVCDTAGHSDAVFGIVQPGQLISSHYKTNYSESFPGWNSFIVPKKTTINNNLWTIPNNLAIEQNKYFSDHISKNAADWIGNYSETVVEVNVLCVDPQNVVLMTENPVIIKHLESIGVTVHVFPLRTWSFWDGGWSCFTLDVHREDTKEDLFPERGENGVYWRLK